MNPLSLMRSNVFILLIGLLIPGIGRATLGSWIESIPPQDRCAVLSQDGHASEHFKQYEIESQDKLQIQELEKKFDSLGVTWTQIWNEEDLEQLKASLLKFTESGRALVSAYQPLFEKYGIPTSIISSIDENLLFQGKIIVPYTVYKLRIETLRDDLVRNRAAYLIERLSGQYHLHSKIPLQIVVSPLDQIAYKSIGAYLNATKEIRFDLKSISTLLEGKSVLPNLKHEFTHAFLFLDLSSPLNLEFTSKNKNERTIRYTSYPDYMSAQESYAWLGQTLWDEQDAVTISKNLNDTLKVLQNLKLRTEDYLDYFSTSSDEWMSLNLKLESNHLNLYRNLEKDSGEFITLNLGDDSKLISLSDPNSLTPFLKVIRDRLQRLDSALSLSIEKLSKLTSNTPHLSTGLHEARAPLYQLLNVEFRPHFNSSGLFQ